MAKKQQKVIKLEDIKIDQILLRERKIFLIGAIDEKKEEEIIKKLITLDAISNEPILFIINSPGGLVTSGVNILNTFTFIKSPVITLISGKACSMGALISVCGDKRLMFRNSFWMAHPMSVGMEDYKEFMEDKIKGIRLLQKQIDKILKRNTKLTKKEIEKVKRGEKWLTANQSLKKGIIDRIL